MMGPAGPIMPPATRISALVGQGGDRYQLDDKVGMGKGRNPDDLRGRRVVVAAMLRAMLGKEFVHHVLTEVGRTQCATGGERSFDVEGEPDQVIQRGAKFLQVGLDVC